MWGKKSGDVFGEFPEVSCRNGKVLGTGDAVNKSEGKSGTLWVFEHPGKTLRTGVWFPVKLRCSVKPGAHQRDGLVCERVCEGNSAHALAWGSRPWRRGRHREHATALTLTVAYSNIVAAQK